MNITNERQQFVLLHRGGAQLILNANAVECISENTIQNSTEILTFSGNSYLVDEPFNIAAGIIYGVAISQSHEKGAEQKEIEPDILDKPIEYLDLSVRAFNCLHRHFRGNGHAGTIRVSDVTNMTMDELTTVRNLGKKGAEDVLSKLDLYGLSLREVAEK